MLLVAVILVGSCKKDSVLNNPNLSTLATTQGQKSLSPVISNTALANWFVKSSMGQYVGVDWKKAKQATIGHVAVVTVPITHISLPGASASVASTSIKR